MLELENIGLFLGDQGLIFSDVNIRFGLTDKVGIIGRNGSGKSSLLKIISGKISPDMGEVKLQQGKRLLFVEQQLPEDEITPLEFLEKADAQLQKLLAQVDAADSDELTSLYDDIDVIETQYKRQAPAILAGLGLSQAEQKSPMKNLSGGFRMRIALASALLQKPDYLLLDEPTNHLDPESSLWLMIYLRSYPGAVLVVSHDVPFLNAITNRTLHVKTGQVTMYQGNYDVFSREYVIKSRQAELGNENREREMARLQANIDRFMSHPSRAGGCHAKEKLIGKMQKEMIIIVPERPIIPINFPDCSPLGNPIIELVKVSIGYGQKKILTDLSLSIQNDSRVVILGRNGQGKSTLVKALVGRLEPLSGVLNKNSMLKIGYYSQEQTDELGVTDTVIDEMRKSMPSANNENIRTHLARFGFGRDMVDQVVGSLSGGEKSRLVFAKISAANPQLIVMDEPTNHLDIESKEELFKQIQAFKGAIIIVSHDWSLLETTVSGRAPSQMWIVEAGRVEAQRCTSLSAYRNNLLGNMDKNNKQSASGLTFFSSGALAAASSSVSMKP